eukprot:scaffold41602_cov27-Tisochrysis_lutea.AAC.4
MNRAANHTACARSNLLRGETGRARGVAHVPPRAATEMGDSRLLATSGWSCLGCWRQRRTRAWGLRA